MKCITVSCLWASDHSVAIAYRPFILICFLAKNPTFRLGLGNSCSGKLSLNLIPHTSLSDYQSIN